MLYHIEVGSKGIGNNLNWKITMKVNSYMNYIEFSLG
jgi:hypothetical protein